MKHTLSAALLALVSSSGCALGMIHVPGKIYSVKDGTVISVDFVPGALGGGGYISGTNTKTGELFEGTFAGVTEGAESVGFGSAAGSAYSNSGATAHGFATGTSFASTNSTTMDNIVMMVGNLGTVLDCKLLVQRGLRPRGIGSCTDNTDKIYRLIF
jgi:hypothetical protein